MSHVVTIATEIRDLEGLCLGCHRLKIPQPVHGTHRLFSAEHAGYAVQLDGWRYPVVCDLEKHEVHFDNFNGRWGLPERLDELHQVYAVERTKLEARKHGHKVTEQSLADGSIKLTVQVGGAV